MKKKLLIILVTVACAFGCAFGLAACNNGDKDGGSKLEYRLKNDGTYEVEKCSAKSVTEITVPDTYGGKPVTGIGAGAFNQCASLENITIPDSVTDIGDGAFSNTPWYRNQPNGVVYAGKVAYTYKGTMPNRTTITFEDGTKGIADCAFRNATNLWGITIPEGVVRIGAEAFYCCASVYTINIPDSVISIGSYAFYNTGWYADRVRVLSGSSMLYAGNIAYEYIHKTVDNVTSVVLKDGTKSIADSVSYRLKNITSITIPESVTYIGELALSYSTKLTSITFNGTKEQWNAIVKGDNWDKDAGNYTVHCADGDIAKNQTAEN